MLETITNWLYDSTTICAGLVLAWVAIAGITSGMPDE